MSLAKAIRRAFTNSRLFSDHIRKFDEDEELMVAQLHVDAHEEGGLACNDKQLLAEMRECIMQWIKSMGRQLLQGNLNLVNTSFPVLMFEPRSYLQKLADIWAYPDLVNRAAAQADPLERMKLLVTWLVAGLHHSVECWRKPFNPIVGETWQATMPGGVRLAMEQVSHHPPVSAYQLEGPGWALNGWSQPAVVPVVKFYGIKTVAKGARWLEFADGGTVEMTMPHFAIKGVVYAAKPHAEVLGVARLLDPKNQLEAVVSFGPVPGTRQRTLARADAVCGEIYQLPRASHLQEAASGGGGALQRSGTAATALDEMVGDVETLALDPASSDGSGDPDPDDEAILEEFNAAHFGGPVAAGPPPAGSSGGGAPPPPPLQQQQQQRQQQQRQQYHRSRSSYFGREGGGGGGGGGQQATVPGVAVARIEGCWLSHLNIDHKRYWTLSEATPEHWRPADVPLPSDLRFREDLAALAASDLDGAQRWKEVLEQQQRSDRKMREAAGVFEHH